MCSLRNPQALPAFATTIDGLAVAMTFWPLAPGIALLAFLGCDTAERDWNKAVALNSVTSYEAYLESHPRSEHANKAKERLVVVRLRDAMQSGRVDALAAFLREHPNSLLDGSARAAFSNAINRELERGIREVIRADLGEQVFGGPSRYDTRFYDSALAIWESVEPHAPDNALLLNNLAVLVAASGDLDRAHDLLKRAAEAEPIVVREISIEKVVKPRDAIAFMTILLPVGEMDYGFGHVWPADDSYPGIYSAAGFWPRRLDSAGGTPKSSASIQRNIDDIVFLQSFAAR